MEQACTTGCRHSVSGIAGHFWVLFWASYHRATMIHQPGNPTRPAAGAIRTSERTHLRVVCPVTVQPLTSVGEVIAAGHSTQASLGPCHHAIGGTLL